MAKGKSNNMDSLFGGFTAPNLNLGTADKPIEKEEENKVKSGEQSNIEKKEYNKGLNTVIAEDKSKTNPKPAAKNTSVEENTAKAQASEERGVSLRLAEQVDETFLDVVSLQNDMTKKQFLANIMSDAVEEAKAVKPKDIDYNEPFRKDVKLKCKQVTILLPTKLYDDINLMAKKYGMATARYIAWSVQKARLKDPDWN